MQPLASLHTHSWYSLLEGVSSPDALLARAVACGYSSLALTDTNNLYGAVPFVEAAKRLDIRPLLGACLRQQGLRCVALIGEPAGWRSLCRVLTRLHLVEKAGLVDLLRENAEGLHILAGDLALAQQLREAFGARLWLEVVRPGPGNRSRHGSERREQELLEGARRLGLRPIASTAAHFATAEGYPAFRLITAARQGGLLDQLPRALSITPDHHLLDRPTLYQRFRDLPEALSNLTCLAEQLSPDALPQKTVLPPAKVPRWLEAHRFLRLLCERGLRRRGLYGNSAAHERLGEELVIIEASGLAPYFLVVRDIARYARHRQLPMALRGSAGNSLVCYLLDITDVDPLRFGLALDRFLHIGRPDLPDIDLDFDWRVRDEIIAHTFERYGVQHTAMVSSHLFLQPRSAFREAGKVHGLSNEQITLLAQNVGVEDGQDVHALPSDGLGETPVPGSFPLEAPRWPWLLRDARLLLGRPHHLSVHPGGIIITPRPIEEYVPVQRAAKGVTITQFDKDGVEAIGLVKIDLLGNRALANVEETLRWVGAAAKPAGIYDDLATLRLLQRGDTLGVNQLESPAMRHLLIQLRPQGIQDIVCALALIRPGAGAVGMKGRYIQRYCAGEPVPKMPACLEPVLRETYGLLVYQDDALGMIRALTGLSIPETHRFYKRATKRVTAEQDRELAQEFRQLCAARGISETTIAEQWQLLTHFRRYTFCKSHAVSYALLAWQCAYAKAHLPQQFWSAVLNNNQGVYPRRTYIEALKRAGLQVLLPCVNHSKGPFTPERTDSIRTGLDAIATLPEEIKLRLLEERHRRGPFHDLADFRRCVEPGPEALATLIRSGALDFTGRNRPTLFLEADLQNHDAPAGEVLFADRGDVGWTPDDYDAARRRADEWDFLGFVADRPLMELLRPLLPGDAVRSVDLPRHKGRRIRTGGVVATGRSAQTERGLEMQFITLEDEWGLMEATIFPGTCPLLSNLTLGPYLVVGVVDEQFGVFTVTAEQFMLVSQDKVFQKGSDPRPKKGRLVTK
jgi:DNA-directed DNA polymerase III PolC